MGRIIGITDIHGEYYKLCKLIDNLEVCKNDLIVFMGDYIDRGKYSREVVDKVISMSEFCNCVYLIGSHEYALLHSKSDDYFNYLFWNYGGDSTVESYGSFEKIFDIHGDFFRNLSPYYLTDKYLFVHAGFRSGLSLDEQEWTDFVYMRGEFYNHKHNLPQKVIFGHTEFPEPKIWDDKICIDTGCGKFNDAPLTAFVSDAGEEYFVNSF